VTGMAPDDVIAQDAAVQRLVIRLAKDYPKAVSSAATQLGLGVARKFTSEEFLAMSVAANLTNTVQCTICKYCLALNNDIFPSNNNIRKLKKGALPPITENVSIRGKIHVCSYQPLD